MKLVNKTLALGAITASLIVPFGLLHADVISLPDDGGFKVFQDTNTGLEWLGLNNFFNQSPAQEYAAASAAGFSWATLDQVQTLLNSLPLDGGQWSSYATIMGSAPNRDLIWGDYTDPSNPNLQNWAWSYKVEIGWSFAGSAGTIDGVANGDGPDADLNLWAVKVGSDGRVPDATSTLVLLGAALLSLAGLRRKI